MTEHEEHWELTLPEREDDLDFIDSLQAILKMYGREKVGEDLAKQLEMLFRGRITGDYYMAAIEHFNQALAQRGITPLDLDMHREYNYYVRHFDEKHRARLRQQVVRYLKGELNIRSD